MINGFEPVAWKLSDVGDNAPDEPGVNEFVREGVSKKR